jgi:hypothetical protein
VTSLSESSQAEVGDNREKWGDFWESNNVEFVVAILKMATGRNFSMSAINSGHHYLPTYQILMISGNVEFLPPIFYTMISTGLHFQNGHHNTA